MAPNTELRIQRLSKTKTRAATSPARTRSRAFILWYHAGIIGGAPPGGTARDRLVKSAAQPYQIEKSAGPDFSSPFQKIRRPGPLCWPRHRRKSAAPIDYRR